MRTLILSMTVGLFLTSAAWAGQCGPKACEPACGQQHGDCGRCGNAMCCQVVPEVREIKKTVWTVKCVPFCAPNPNCRHRDDCGSCGDTGCTTGCTSTAACETGCKSSKCDPCAGELAKEQIPPKCGPVRYKKVLEKKEIVCKVPSFKCVPVCNSCNGGCGDAGNAAPAEKSEKAAPAPAPAPAPDPKTTMTAPMPPALFSAAYSN